MKIITQMKDAVKRSPFLTQLYYILSLLPGIPPKDFRNIHKLRTIFTVKPYSGLSYSRLAKIYELAVQIETENIAGACVECGVWNGGSAAIVAELTKQNAERELWLFDSWEGLPEPTQYDLSPKGELGEKGTSFGYQEKVEELIFQKMGLARAKIHLMKGWFQETIPPRIAEIGPIALVHLDCDWYESVRFCLNQLYDRVVPGGFVVIDDYGYWQGCKKAVDEFFEARKLQMPLHRVDDIGVYFRKNAYNHE